MKKHKRNRWLYTVSAAALCLVLNLLGAKLAGLLPLPLFLDAVGTVLAAALCGYIPGILVGFATNYINSASDAITLYYGICSVLFALYTAWFTRRGGFRRPIGLALSVLVLAVIGGGLGSVLTWLLYGNDIGTGISAPLAVYFYEQTALGKFFAQLFADLAIDVFDKLVTLLLVLAAVNLSPKPFLRRFPQGRYLLGERGAKHAAHKRLRHYIRYSLKYKVATIITITALILGFISVVISSAIYRGIMTDRFTETGKTAVTLMQKSIDAERIDEFLLEGEAAYRYRETELALSELKAGMPDIEYMYVYQIREDGCHVVFDLDTPELQGEAPGTVVDFDESFLGMLPALLAGEEIAPIITKGQYGWLLTVYRPLRDSRGVCKAYAAADIDMRNVVADRSEFTIRIVALLFGASVLIVGFVLSYVDDRVVTPLNDLANAAAHFAFDNAGDRARNTARIQSLQLKTGDEIENLYHAMAKTTGELAEYMREIESKNEYISRLKDNIIFGFAELVESRDDNTGKHIQRTAAYVKAIGEALYKRGLYPDTLTPAYLSTIVNAAPLHDIGKIKIPDAILNKPGKLTPAEYEIIKTHTTLGRAVLRGVFSGVGGDISLTEAQNMACCHHERWDGTGYPEGLAGEAIPLSARIMSLADVFDALLSKRSYKEAFPFSEALSIIAEGAGGQFDPVITAVFLDIADELRRISGWTGR